MAHNVCCDSYRVYNVTCIYYPIILGSSMWRVLFLGAVVHWTWYIHGTNHSTHCEPSGIPNAHSHTVKNFMVLSLAWGWRFKSKHVALTYAFIIWLCWLQYISIKWLYRIKTQRDDFVQKNLYSSVSQIGFRQRVSVVPRDENAERTSFIGSPQFVRWT